MKATLKLLGLAAQIRDLREDILLALVVQKDLAEHSLYCVDPLGLPAQIRDLREDILLALAK